MVSGATYFIPMPRRLSSRPTTKPKRRNEKSERQYDRKKEKTEILSPNARKKLELQQALKELENSTPRPSVRTSEELHFTDILSTVPSIPDAGNFEIPIQKNNQLLEVIKEESANARRSSIRSNRSNVSHSRRNSVRKNSRVMEKDLVHVQDIQDRPLLQRHGGMRRTTLTDRQINSVIKNEIKNSEDLKSSEIHNQRLLHGQITKQINKNVEAEAADITGIEKLGSDSNPNAGAKKGRKICFMAIVFFVVLIAIGLASLIFMTIFHKQDTDCLKGGRLYCP